MIQVCCQCGTHYGEKEPLDVKTHTHGFCPPCYRAQQFEFLSTKAVEVIFSTEPDNWLARFGWLKQFVGDVIIKWQKKHMEALQRELSR